MTRYLLLLSLVLFIGCNSATKRSEKKLLVYGSQADWQTPKLAELLVKIEEVAAGGEITIDTTSRMTSFEEENLKNYGGIVLLANNIDLLPVRQHVDIERYVQSGGGLLGINVDTTSHLYWPWVHDQMRLAENPQVQFVTIDAIDLINETFLPLFESIIDENSYDFSLVTQQRAPDPARFVKDVLDNNINEPMKLAVLPDQRVLFIERRGEIKLYEPEKRATRLIDKFDVRLDGNYEDGMLGMALDPDFETNNWVYIYYSPINTAIQSLSRFVLYGGDSLVRETEKVVLEVPVQIETCCHSGGDVVFGPDGMLYLSTGDNTSSKESDGYSPLDERPGRGPYDSQKGSSNTHDLRGKILRIKPESDGTYSIPDGNLFAKDGSEGKPEIYLMGLRNPFRFTIHPFNNDVYWGEVGPDAGKDSKYGQRSFDEYNRASAPGFFGWPYFQGNNIPYPSRDFETDQVGELFDPAAPKNRSPNNTGSIDLPPAQESLIWYPYNLYDKFPMLGAGSRSAMGGPFFHSSFYPEDSRVKMPDYYNNKWFIYEWARSWVKVVTFDENDELVKIEPFYEENEFHKPIDFAFGPDGAIYMLEYGANYFANNSDASLIKISYAGGNLQPVPVAKADKVAGAAPLTVEFSGEGSFDPDPGDVLAYSWSFEDPSVVTDGQAVISHTFTTPGIYKPTLTVKDKEGESMTTQLEVRVGNEPPSIVVDFQGNKSFYFENESIPYSIEVMDLEDGSLAEGSLAAEDVHIMFSYLSEGKDLALLNPGAMFGASGKYAVGKGLMEGSDCMTCHSMNQTSIGPTYIAISERYENTSTVVDTLAAKILEGGSGNWGHNIMAAHPQHTQEEAEEMVKYILSLAETSMEGANLPSTGEVTTSKHEQDDDGLYLFGVSYTDKGGESIGSITSQEFISLTYPALRTDAFDYFQDAVQRREPTNNDLSYVSFVAPGAYVGYKSIDLSGIGGASFRVRSSTDFTISIRSGGPNGEVLTEITSNHTDRKWIDLASKLTNGQLGDVYIMAEWEPGERTRVDFEYVKFSK